jgi:thymidine kinase
MYRAGKDFGWIVAISGSMFGGKSEDLIRRVHQIQRINDIVSKPLSVGVFKHSIDQRYSTHEIASHNGQRVQAIPVASVAELVNKVQNGAYRIIVIDEVQFFQEEAPITSKERTGHQYSITDAIEQFAKQKSFVIVAGLDKTFRGTNFGPMGEILSVADEVHKYQSICTQCGAAATLPQRLINGVPAKPSDPTIVVGAKETYEPRCRNCHTLGKEDGISLVADTGKFA